MDRVTAYEQIIDGYLASLAADSVNPKASYSMNGQSVDRNAWRAGLLKQIKEVKELILGEAPFEIQSVSIL